MQQWLHVFILLSIPFSIMPQGLAQAKTEKMVYLAFHWVGGQPKLKSFEVVPGKLKQGRMANLPGTFLHCKMKNAENQTIYETNLPAPDHWLTEVPTENGSMRRVKRPADTSDFYLRLPYFPGIQTLEVTRMSPAGNGQTFLKKPWISLRIDFDSKQGGAHEQ